MIVQGLKHSCKTFVVANKIVEFSSSNDLKHRDIVYSKARNFQCKLFLGNFQEKIFEMSVCITEWSVIFENSFQSFLAMRKLTTGIQSTFLHCLMSMCNF